MVGARVSDRHLDIICESCPRTDCITIHRILLVHAVGVAVFGGIAQRYVSRPIEATATARAPKRGHTAFAGCSNGMSGIGRANNSSM